MHCPRMDTPYSPDARHPPRAVDKLVLPEDLLQGKVFGGKMPPMKFGCGKEDLF